MTDRHVRGAAALALLVTLAGCTEGSDFRTITLADGDIPPTTFERDILLGPGFLEACPPGTFEVSEQTGGVTTVTLQPEPFACRVTLLEDDAVILSEAEIRAFSDALDPWEIDGIQSARFVLTDFVLTDGEGFEITTGDFLDGIEIAVGGFLLFTTEDIIALENGVEIEKDLPPQIFDALVFALESGQELVAEVDLMLLVRNDALIDFPDAIFLRATIQPVLDVDVIEAAL
jgi:hypothetical protein